MVALWLRKRYAQACRAGFLIRSSPSHCLLGSQAWVKAERCRRVWKAGQPSMELAFYLACAAVLCAESSVVRARGDGLLVYTVFCTVQYISLSFFLVLHGSWLRQVPRRKSKTAVLSEVPFLYRSSLASAHCRRNRLTSVVSGTPRSPPQRRTHGAHGPWRGGEG